MTESIGLEWLVYKSGHKWPEYDDHEDFGMIAGITVALAIQSITGRVWRRKRVLKNNLIVTWAVMTKGHIGF